MASSTTWRRLGALVLGTLAASALAQEPVPAEPPAGAAPSPASPPSAEPPRAAETPPPDAAKAAPTEPAAQPAEQPAAQPAEQPAAQPAPSGEAAAAATAPAAAAQPAAPAAAETAAKPPPEAAAPPPLQIKGVAPGKIELGGALEFEARWVRSNSLSERSLGLATAEFDFEAKLVEWAKAELAVDWNRDVDIASSTFNVNEAFVTFGDEEKGPAIFKLGLGVVPFGLSTGSTVAAKLEDTLTITDPLTILTFDMKRDYALFQGRYRGFEASVYTFDGATQRKQKHREHYGGALGWAMKEQALTVTTGLSIIDSIFESDELFAAYSEPPYNPGAQSSGWVPGAAAHVKLGLGRYLINAAYYGALGVAEFIRGGSLLKVKPEAWHAEAGYVTAIAGMKTVLGVGYSQTYGLAGTVPEWRGIATSGLWLRENLRIALEYAVDKDYNKNSYPSFLLPTYADKSKGELLTQLLYEW